MINLLFIERINLCAHWNAQWSQIALGKWEMKWMSLTSSNLGQESQSFSDYKCASKY